jgi:hypothetical protein
VCGDRGRVEEEEKVGGTGASCSVSHAKLEGPLRCGHGADPTAGETTSLEF